MPNSSYDDWKLDTPDNHIKASGKCCTECGNEIARNQEYIETNTHGYFHDNDLCFERFCWDFFDANYGEVDE